jgi:hypothetical protein
MRVPDKDALEDGVRWEGDLPGTSLATSADIMERAETISWIKKNEKGNFYRARPPRDFINDYLPQMRGRYGARVLRGIARLPRIDDNGDIHLVTGYDPTTGLYHDRTPTFEVPNNPSRMKYRRPRFYCCSVLYKLEDKQKERRNFWDDTYGN